VKTHVFMDDSIGMERRNRNQVEREAMRMATRGGMIRNPLSSGE
jgi:hypothetical protein